MNLVKWKELCNNWIFQINHFLSKFIFTYECKFNPLNSDENQFVQRESNKLIDLMNFKVTFKFGKVNEIFWGCFSSKSFENFLSLMK